MSEDSFILCDSWFDEIRTESDERQKAIEATVMSQEQCESQMVR